ncbi:MAG: sulfate adenylyltransferase, partial [Candidatus Marinimicrobia bacterium]|nr:sulfate adenylyltransferase [Candidatus Neomarinimicrobiota bacterium]
MPSSIIAPHGGRLVNLLLPPDEARTLKGASIKFPSVFLNDRQLCDLELLLNGGFSPLTGFLGREDYESVLARLRLADDSLWPMPITLDVSEQFAQSIDAGARVILRDKEGFPLAVLTVTDIWRPDLEAEARELFGTTDLLHPGAFYLLDTSQPVYLGGTLQGITPPKHYDYQLLRHTPAEVRDRFTRHGWDKVVAFQTRNPLHRAHLELTHRAAGSLGANLLIHPVVGLTKPGDVDHYTRVRCYEHVIEKYPAGTAMLSLLPLAMRMGGPREALWHAIIRKNYGCGYFIVGRDHAGPGQDSEGQPFYGPYDAQDLLREHEKELGIRMIPFKMMVYVEDRAEFMPVDEVPEGARTLEISGTELRRRLDKGLDIPDWFSFPEVVAELRRARPPLSERGFTVFF